MDKADTLLRPSSAFPFPIRPNRSFFRAVIGLLATFLLTGCGRGPSDEEIAARIAQSHPAWESYQEDIKGQIGAGPVAEWDGDPLKLWIENDRLFIVFGLRGPWAARDTGLPILLRDPSGHTQQNLRVNRENGGRVLYTFTNPGGGSIPAWMEIKYPRAERRLVLSERGEWQEKQQ